MFALVVRFDLKDDAAAAGFDALVAETAKGIASEPGTLTYVVHTVNDEPLARIFYELYADRAGFEAHNAEPHTRHFLAEREQYLAGTRVEFLGVDATRSKGLGRSS